MKYEPVTPVSRLDAEAAFAICEPTSICAALLGLTYYDSDWNLVQNLCIKFVENSKNQEIRSLAVTCLGHLVHIHGKLDTQKVIPLLKSLQNDPQIRGRVQDALDDIEMFVK